MDTEQRRGEVLKLLRAKEVPISGAYLAQNFKVSRQVIVQDIAVLRAAGYDLLATARGYILNREINTMCQRVVLVKHNTEDTEEELNTIIDNGGRVRNVIIAHPIYGQLVGDLMLKSRRDVKAFVEQLEATKASPLSKLTAGTHMHTIEATDEAELDIIEEELKKKGFLILEGN